MRTLLLPTSLALIGCATTPSASDGGSDGGLVTTCAEARALVASAYEPVGVRCGSACTTNITCTYVEPCSDCAYHMFCVDGVVHLAEVGYVCPPESGASDADVIDGGTAHDSATSGGALDAH